MGSQTGVVTGAAIKDLTPYQELLDLGLLAAQLHLYRELEKPLKAVRVRKAWVG